MLSIAICDDEVTVTEQMQKIMNHYKNERSLEIQCDIFHDGESLVKENKEYDIIFLDIFMKGIDGIEAGKRIRTKDKNVEIIYLTSYLGLTKEALSVHAFEYLEKPIRNEAIFYQLDEVMPRLLHRKGLEEKLLCSMEFNSGKYKIKIPLNDIYYFEREERKIKAVTKKGDFIFYETIASIEKRSKKYDFILSHQSFVVNLNNVKDYVKDEIIMTNNNIIPLAQKRASEFKKTMREFLQRKLEDKM